jgi:hypothetical protein
MNAFTSAAPQTTDTFQVIAVQDFAEHAAPWCYVGGWDAKLLAACQQTGEIITVQRKVAPGVYELLGKRAKWPVRRVG